MESSDLIKIRYTINRLENKSVAIVPSEEWYNLIREDGKLTELKRLPKKFSKVEKEASMITSVASGSVVRPGMKILRYDPSDEPYVINVDQYDVIENFHQHEMYEEVLKQSNINDTPELQRELKNNVYIIKQPPNDETHWFKDFKDYYLNALKKDDT